MFCEKFGIEKNMTVGITGSGGKTSLMFLLAKELSKKGRVLVTTTTKIYEPLKDKYEYLFLTEKNEKIKGNGKNIFILGKKIENGKLISPEEKEILKYKNLFDYILYEGDGAKRKLMKIWKDNEPCILSFTDIVIGVANIKILGLSYENIHRYDMYIDKNKKYIDMEDIKDYLLYGKFFRNFSGKKIYFLNGVEEEKEIEEALKISKYFKNFLFGSVEENKIYKISEISAIVMASGKSERFGKNKLLEKIDGLSMLEIILKKINKFPFKKIFVTYKDKEIFEICKKYDVIALENKKYYLGQSESIKLAVKDIEDENMMFFTADMPFLKEKTIKEILFSFDGKITIPNINGKNSSPVIFPNRYKSSFILLNGDTGGREIIKKEKDLKFINFYDEKEFLDIDTSEEFLNIKKQNTKGEM